MTARPNRNGLVAAALVAVFGGMVGLTFAAVPLYTLFCQATGYAGTPRRAASGADHTLDREVVVRFDGNVAGLPWDFRPEVPEVTLRLGETATVNFVAENTGAKAVTGTATFNVQPDVAGAYFNKIECFCFTEQTLAAGERAELPVQFFVSPDLAGDHELSGTRTITLSYTFFPAIKDGKPLAQASDDADGKRL
jgi:cytochrome c oxidase assembly protein subunit 11